MSGNSAKRSGIEVEDPDLESRLRRVELDVERRQLATNQTEETVQRRIRSAIPRITGLSLDNSVIGGISVKWNPVDTSPSRYELQIATNSSFTENLVTFKLNDPVFLFPNELDPENTFYVRVRAASTRSVRGIHDAGDWSATLNTSTGQASYTNLQRGAATRSTAFKQTVFNPSVVDNSAVVTYSMPLIDMPTSTDVLILGVFYFLLDGFSDTQDARITILLDGVAVQNFTIAGNSDIDVVSFTLPLIAPSQSIEAGSHRVAVKVESLSASAGDDILPQELNLFVVELRR